jgi:hypothetical protein
MTANLRASERRTVGAVALEREAVEREVRRHKTLEDVVAWSLALKPPRMIRRVVAQDEYTLDVILPVGEGVVLVYDTT